MKKRLLSLLMAMCLMATMVPAAFAADTDQPDTITLPNGEVPGDSDGGVSGCSGDAGRD